MSIELESSNLARRGQEISKLLRLLSRVPSGPAFTRLATATTVIFGTYDGARVTSPYGQWRFATYRPRYRAGYYEIWNSLVSSGGKVCCLNKAYLHIYQVNPADRSETEILALHCDPEENGQAGAKYKRGPHLHISAAPDPFSKAHIALAVGYLSVVLKSASNLTEALGWSIQMIKDEILDRL